MDKQNTLYDRLSVIDYSLAIERNEALIQATAYRDVENTMLNEEKPLTKGRT